MADSVEPRPLRVPQDPLFIEKVRDNVGLYLNRPDQVLVLCVGESAQIQALDCTQPFVAHTPRPTRPGSTYWSAGVPCCPEKQLRLGPLQYPSASDCIRAYISHTNNHSKPFA